MWNLLGSGKFLDSYRRRRLPLHLFTTRGLPNLPAGGRSPALAQNAVSPREVFHQVWREIANARKFDAQVESACGFQARIKAVPTAVKDG
jgi:hypothetical protein